MTKKLIILLAAFALTSVCVVVAGFTVEPNSTISPIKQDSPCPVVGCASGTCHGFDNVPQPDGINTMDCPEATCSSVQCHGWEQLFGTYKQASDASLNLWIMAPVVLVAGLVLLVLKLR